MELQQKYGQAPVVKHETGRLPNHAEQRDSQRQLYEIYCGYEREDPDLVTVCQIIQGNCYERNGFVHRDRGALDEIGRLHAAIDQARGENVEYHLAVRSGQLGEGTDDVATIRRVSIPSDGNLDDLPAFRHAAGKLTTEADARLRAQFERVGPPGVIELAALANTDSTRTNPIASFELVRSLYLDAINQSRDELWLITFVPHAGEVFRNSYSKYVIESAGELISIGADDTKINDAITLAPVIVEPARIIENTKRFFADFPDDPSLAAVARSLNFLTDGIDEQRISADDREFLDLLKIQKRGA